MPTSWNYSGHLRPQTKFSAFRLNQSCLLKAPEVGLVVVWVLTWDRQIEQSFGPGRRPMRTPSHTFCQPWILIFGEAALYHLLPIGQGHTGQLALPSATMDMILASSARSSKGGLPSARNGRADRVALGPDDASWLSLPHRIHIWTRCAEASGVARRAKAPGPTFVWSRLCWAPFALPAEFCNGLHTPPSPENAPQSRAFLQGPNVPDPGEWEQRPTGTPAVRMHGVHRRDFYMVVTAELIAASPAHPGNALCGRKSIS
jgi:hypothetical protein